MVARGWGKKEMGSCYSMSKKFQFTRKSSEDWLHGNVDILNATKLYTEKKVNMINLMLHAFYYN